MSADIQDLIIKDEDHRLIEGWATVEIVDRQGDLVPVDAMKEAFINFMSNGGLLMKDHKNKPVGKVLWWGLEKKEGSDIDGIKLIGEINKNGLLADETWHEIQGKVLRGFSIGGRTLDKDVVVNKSGERVNVLKKIELNEISLVGEPANPLALFTGASLAKGNYSEGEDVDPNNESTRFFDGAEDTIVRKFLKASYPWDECIADQEKRYGSKEKAQKICGAIRSRYGKSVDDEWMESGINSNKSVDEIGKAIEEAMIRKYVTVEKGFLWDDCIKDQMDRYHDMGDAENVCGAIRRKVMEQKEREKFHTHAGEQSKSLDKGIYTPVPLEHGIVQFLLKVHEGDDEKTLEEIRPKIIEQLKEHGVDGEEAEKLLVKFGFSPEAGKTRGLGQIGRSDGENTSEVYDKSNINKENKIGETMSGKVSKSDTQLTIVGGKNMNDDVHTESDGIGAKEEHKGKLSTEIEEREHKREERAKGDDEEEEEKEVDPQDERVDRLERAMTELHGLLSKVLEKVSAAGDERKADMGEQEEEEDERREETEKANYSFRRKDENSDEPEGKPEGRSKGGVGIEQIVGPDMKKGAIKKSSGVPSNVIGMNEGNNFAKAPSVDTDVNDFTKSLESVLKGKATTKSLYYGRRK